MLLLQPLCLLKCHYGKMLNLKNHLSSYFVWGGCLFMWKWSFAVVSISSSDSFNPPQRSRARNMKKWLLMSVYLSFHTGGSTVTLTDLIYFKDLGNLSWLVIYLDLRYKWNEKLSSLTLTFLILVIWNLFRFSSLIVKYYLQLGGTKCRFFWKSSFKDNATFSFKLNEIYVKAKNITNIFGWIEIIGLSVLFYGGYAPVKCDNNGNSSL